MRISRLSIFLNLKLDPWKDGPKSWREEKENDNAVRTLVGPNMFMGLEAEKSPGKNINENDNAGLSTSALVSFWD
jgi:hypothetical protein